MKNKLFGIITIFISIFLILSYWGQPSNNYKNIHDIDKKLIRFHVLANSDSEEDQKLKIKVKNSVLEYIYPKLSNSRNISESRKILMENTKDIKKVAENVILKNGYDYDLKLELTHDNFPVKTYGNITLPQGNYEAFRIIIGNGKGKNWWCVMFPPLCFVDVTKGEIAYEETEKIMETYLETDDIEEDLISNDKIKFEFKIVEIIKDIFK
ncbi:stage II sporulation protein R [Clostridium cochlearium]|uniref:Stage II sporulation protein R n=1 Tax=Clostridium cochlearium TaxID=1494 RepID=A0A239YZU0_CLOCO|nr:stage II sporulation protein R [Clostridium cochlearium]MBV1818789.1 stage II sporulation protein R [Bacteroidales bacterium MSK.15.36]MCG4572108.1 stage II sporulation protein R [Clostridium cochlearium]MCG4580440.1 stage II sporulation protein R [Clostridium cochlearium]MCR1972176.1 stage II sporulation protein R [Clostridium cochlearium]MDU1443912.1 stage II sporulation protein R [Clostridium cochlearium]